MSCPVCASNTLAQIGPYRASSPLMAKRHRAQCSTCSLVFADPLPSEADWEAYNADYFTSAHGEAHLAPRAVTFRAALGKIRADFIAQEAAARGLTIHRILEIGPGFGELAEAWIATHPNTAYCAVETDSSVYTRLTSIGVSLVPDMKTISGEGFDLVLASHVLEHTLDPVGFLSSMAQCTKSGGLIFVETPCRDDLYKTGDEPHTLFFDKPAMADAAKRAGLTGLKLSYHGEARQDLIAERDRSRPIRLMMRGLREIRLDRNLGLPPSLSAPERRIVRGFDAHRASQSPARWIRLTAQTPN